MNQRPIPARIGSGDRERRERAESLGVAALTFLAADVGRLGRFLALTGLDPMSLRAAAQHPDFLAGVLEHLGCDETLLLAFAAHAGIDPADVDRARIALSGGAWERDSP